MKDSSFSRILIATDGSEAAAAAVSLAGSFAHASGAAVRIVHVWNLEVHHRAGVWDVETRSEARRLVDSSISLVRRLGISADGEILHADHGRVAVAIAEAARNFEANLIVIGSRGLSDWQSILTDHSVSHELLTRVDCPVLVVRGPSPATEHASKRVLLAIAGGDDIEPAMAAAIAAAASPGSSVLVLHVAQAIFGAQGFAWVESGEEINQVMARSTELLSKAGITASATVAPHGPVAETVLAAAARWEADVIVIGSSRMGDLGSLVLGSVTHNLLRASARPILVAEKARP